MRILKCPHCGNLFRQDQSSALPFCSERCRLIDLGGWLDEKYSVPVQRDDDDEEEFDQFSRHDGNEED